MHVRQSDDTGAEQLSPRLELAVRQLAIALLEELRTANDVADPPERLFSIEETARVLGMGRTRLRAEIRAGRLKSLHAGRRHLVALSAIRAYGELGDAGSS